MTKLEQLIEELCPDGVEYVPLQNAVSIERGKRVVKQQLSQTEGYPVYQNSLTPLGFYSEHNHSSGTTYIIVAGAAGEIGYSEVDFWAADDCFAIVCPKTISNRYIYHVLLNYQQNIKGHVRKASIPRLPRTAIENLRIPIPPLSVQNEIVQILDNFTKLLDELIIELSKRHAQYNYYRSLLLSFDGVSTNWLTIESLCEISRGKVISKDYIRDNPGEYPVYSSQTENDGVLGRISEYSYEGEYLTWTTDGANAGTIFHRKGRFNITNVCGLLKPVSTDINIRYLYFILGMTADKYVSRGMGNPKLMSNVMARIKVPVPPLEEQERIVSILDRFDALCGDISSGLPAEIAARQKQYEYYRDKLLTFKERIA